MIEAKVICDSISPQDIRITTMQLRYNKYIHSEFMTHRVFSRNASSSRAVPVSKNLEEVRSDELRAAPIWWGREQKGMASGEELDDSPPEIRPDDGSLLGNGWSPKGAARDIWKDAALRAVSFAEELVHIGAHKSIVNRILEPFLHINVVVTATEYDNFFGLRLDRAAQPEMRVLAEAMWKARQESAPQLLQPGQWHLPFIDPNVEPTGLSGEPLQVSIRMSVARCARVSYLSFDTGRRSTIEEDLALYERLVGAQPLHASPAEHQATPDEYSDYGGELGPWLHPEQWGNFRGWRQYRKMLANEAVAPLPEAYR